MICSRKMQLDGGSAQTGGYEYLRRMVVRPATMAAMSLSQLLAAALAGSAAAGAAQAPFDLRTEML